MNYPDASNTTKTGSQKDEGYNCVPKNTNQEVLWWLTKEEVLLLFRDVIIQRAELALAQKANFHPTSTNSTFPFIIPPQHLLLVQFVLEIGRIGVIYLSAIS